MTTLFLEIHRDKNCFGRCRSVREVYKKQGYRIKHGLVQVKHSGEWIEVRELNEASTDFTLGLYRRMNKEECNDIVNLSKV